MDRESVYVAALGASTAVGRDAWSSAAFVSSSDFVAPAECWGDVSAAALPLAISLATIAAAKGYANGAYAFLTCSSESGERGAALLEVLHSAEHDEP